jgi:uncharacterized protein YybS (DUF2232 family)
VPLTSIEWIVTIFAVLGIIKIIVILINPGKWLDATKEIYKNPGVASVVSLVLAAIVFYFLLQELTIVQIVAATAFVALLVAFIFLQYSKDLLSLAKKMLDRKISAGWQWLYIIIWAVLLLWALYEIFLV